MAPKPKTRDRVKALIREHGPMTTEEIAAELGMLKKTISSCISNSRSTKAKHFYVKDYLPQRGRSGLPAARFALGNRRDAPFPETNRKATARRYYDRNKGVIKARRTTREASPFKSMITQLVTA
ncbi:hypothetical protein [Paraburkholderia sp. WP4_3_2]|uniref:hypothetical protein n=1 Tax=Paraburkholderia sp. WP4_3_2 TaxID=2587162 RepID=UPI0016109971|nr:hypothetical protein [Paraburkholderia sp. WP4_3_2]MBB3256889.1 putative ArsR family transcriptional regulator [Paraburkholderia sp. WP4_3_2]